ncbi:hypothetical protein [Nocardia asteroides]|uniref:hypothetical protein n=1 Tax=Nocardia asteroides TaxID=1824 RepID=UPI001E48B35C|nr:hypothetical protein [Nocardia asteroides]UGT52805.1 hypothetical protein LTT85_19025 [Nocardia asteroides]
MRTAFEFDVHTAASPAQVVELLTDFSANRPNRWPALSARSYEVYSVGDTEAVVLEGQDFPKIYATWHYDWSTPGTVSMSVTESPHLAAGSYHVVTASAAPDGGTDVHGVWDNTARSRSAKVGLLMMRLMGRRFFTVYYRKVFDGLVGG